MQFGAMIATVFQIWMLVECFRRGQAWPWFMIIFFFPGFGALAYFILEVQTWVPLGGGGGGGRSIVNFRSHRVTAADLEEAASDVRRLDTAVAWSKYAELLRARNKHAEAASAAATALEKDPDEIDARYERGRSLFELKEYADALAELELVVRADVGHDYGDALLAKARCQEELGDLDAARLSYETLAARSSRPEVAYQLAVVQEKTGDRAAAVATLQRILDEAELAPGFAQRKVASHVARARRALRSLQA